MGVAELAIIVAIVCVLGFPIIGSIVGIGRALRRRKAGTRSVSAVVMASIAGLISVSMIGKSPWPLSGAACALSFTWIVIAALANREASGMARRERT